MASNHFLKKFLAFMLHNVTMMEDQFFMDTDKLISNQILHLFCIYYFILQFFFILIQKIHFVMTKIFLKWIVKWCIGVKEHIFHFLYFMENEIKFVKTKWMK